jgi:hypothetical protein
MTTKPAVSDLPAQRTLTEVGASREGTNSGNEAYKELPASLGMGNTGQAATVSGRLRKD